MLAPKVTIIGMYTYSEAVFDNMVLPENVPREDVIATILEKCGDFGLIYPDFDFMKMIIGVWSRNSLLEWSKLQETLEFEYDPISNYDRHEEITRELSGEQSGENSRTVSGSNSSEFSNTSDSSASGSTSTSNVAFEAQSQKVVAETESEQENHVANVGSNSDESNGTESGTASSTNNESETTRAHLYGNIGVTTTQNMIKEQREIVKFNLPDYIADSFSLRFCIRVF